MLLWVPEVLFRVQLRESKFFASLRRPNATGTRGKTATGNPIRPSSSTQGTTMPTLPGVPRIPTKSPGNVSLQISRTLRMKAHKIHSDIFLHFGIEPKSDRCFCYFTAAMFVSPSEDSEGDKHGVSIQSSINLGDTLLQITHEWKTAWT